jgi:hypothetical protein
MSTVKHGDATTNDEVQSEPDVRVTTPPVGGPSSVGRDGLDGTIEDAAMMAATAADEATTAYGSRALRLRRDRPAWVWLPLVRRMTWLCWLFMICP